MDKAIFKGPNFGYIPESVLGAAADDNNGVEPGYAETGEVLYTSLINNNLPENVNEQNDDAGQSRSGKIFRRYIKSEGLGDHHIEIYNNWTKNTASNNVYGRTVAFRDGVVVSYENLKIFPPRYSRDGKILLLTPKMAREQGVTYGSDWHVDVVSRRGDHNGPEIDRIPGICIGTIPTMLKSQHCILNGKSPRELALYGEDPEDPGGYLIIDGVEKVVLLQEQLDLNKIFLMNMDSKGSTVARMTVATQRGTTLIELALDKKTRRLIKIRFPSMRSKQGEKYKSINVLRVFRYLFRTVFHISASDDLTQIQNLIMLFITPENVKKSMLKLISNLVDFIAITEDVELIASKMDKSNVTRVEKLKAIDRVFETDLFPHLNNLPGPDDESIENRTIRITRSKVQLLAIMVAQFLEHLAGFRALDDRDSWSNKRIEGAGRMMESLFRNAWRRTLSIIQGQIDGGTIKNIHGVVERLRHSIITDTFHDSFITNNWGVKGSQMKNNVAQTLVRDSVTATFAHINTIDVSISRTDRQHSLRMIQNSQWGFVCCVLTPEGENCLTSGSQIYGANGQLTTIGQVKDGDKMLTINPQTYELVESTVTRCFTRSSEEHGKQVYDVTTLNGKTVTATGDHRFLTALGFTQVSELRTDQDHLCVAYAPTPYLDTCDQSIVLITKPQFIQQMILFGMGDITALNYANTLERDGYLPLMNNHKNMTILTRIIGFMTADGNITIKKGYPALTGYFGCVYDADTFRTDIHKLGYKVKPSKYAVYTMTEEVTERKVTHHVSYTGPFTGLLLALGVRHGRKTNQTSECYTWLNTVSKLARREFLGGIIGGDGGAIRVTNSTNGTAFHITHFSHSKRKAFLDSGHQFMRNLSNMFEEFGVNVSKIREEKYAQGITLRIDFAQSYDNIIRYMYNIGFRYCNDKLTKSLQFAEYLKYREFVMTEGDADRSAIITLHNQGVAPLEISTRLNLKHKFVRKTCCNKVEKHTKIHKDAMTYDQWKECTHTVNGCVYIPLKSVTLAAPCMVSDYTTFSDNHTIICANGIVSHNCGLLKNLGSTAKVSVERSDSEIIRHLIGDRGMEWRQRVSSDETERERWPDKIMVNGKFLGWCNGEETRQYLVDLRRSDQLPPDMSVIKKGDWLYVVISPSRIVRPLLIVDPDQQLAIDRLGFREAPVRRMLTSGAMEYISSWEQEYIKLAAKEEDITKRLDLIRNVIQTHQQAVEQFNIINEGGIVEVQQDGTTTTMSLEEATGRVNSAVDFIRKLENNKPYTHCELDPLAILSVPAALIPWPNHNQAPRNTYQGSMGKQALGIYHSNHLNRNDGKTKVLAFPGRPLVETPMYNLIGLDHRGPGEMVEIGFMAFPFTEEDAFIVKKEFLDNGGFRLYKYLTYKTIVKNPGEITEQLTLPTSRPGEPTDRYKYIQMYEKGNPNNGLPMIGAPLTQGLCVIGKEQYVQKSKEVRNESVILRVGDEGVVDKVLVTSDNKTVVVIVKLRTMRVPQEGDKFAPRNAQKGTIGLVVSDIDLPSNLQGITSDFIVNTHSLPSRMTMEYPMELIASKFAALKGTYVNGGAFEPFLLDVYRQTLIDYGRDEFGYETMRSGLSGKLLPTPIYSGPVFFQALKHHVKDKAQARSTGQVKPMTRQPPRGRGNKGGLRFGKLIADVVNKITAGLRHRRRHNQIQGNSQIIK